MIDIVFIRPPRITDAYACIAFLTSVSAQNVHVLAKDHEIQTVLTNCDIVHKIHFLSQTQNVGYTLNKIVKNSPADWILFCDPDQLNNGLDSQTFVETLLQCEAHVLLPENYTHICPRYSGLKIENIPSLPFVFGIHLKLDKKMTVYFDGAFTTLEWTFLDCYYRFYPFTFLYKEAKSICVEPWLNAQRPADYEQRDALNGILFCWKHLPFLHWGLSHIWCLIGCVFLFRLKRLRAVLKAVIRAPRIRFIDRKASYFRPWLNNREILL